MNRSYKENPFDDLYRIIDIVARARYNAQRRLMIHSSLARFTITFDTLALIIIPLLDLGGLNRNYTPRYLQIMQIVFAVVLLAYSLLLSIGQFDIRADRMHQNGLTLSRMLRELKLLLGAPMAGKEAVYGSFVTRYYDTLEKAENYRQVDYHAALLTQALREGLPKREEVSSNYIFSLAAYLYQISKLRIRVYSIWLLIFSHYILSIMLIYGWIVFMMT
jgi:hypothetical protein